MNELETEDGAVMTEEEIQEDIASQWSYAQHKLEMAEVAAREKKREAVLDAVARLHAIGQEPPFEFTPTPEGMPEDELSNWEHQVGYADLMDQRRQRADQELRAEEAFADLTRAATALLGGQERAPLIDGDRLVDLLKGHPPEPDDGPPF